MDLRQKAERALALRALSDALTAEARALAAQVQEDMRQLGTDRVTVSDDTLTELGKLTKNPDRMVWGIVDPHAFKQWVEANRPGELMTSVNPAFVKWVLAEAEAHKGIVGDPETGQQIPGLGQEKRFGTFVVKSAPVAKERAAAVVEKMLTAGVAALPPVEE